MLPQEGRDLDVLLVRELPAVRVELSGRTLRGGGSPRIPGVSGLDRASGGGILGARRSGFRRPQWLRRTQAETHIRGQSLEQRTGISGFGFVSFFRDQ